MHKLKIILVSCIIIISFSVWYFFIDSLSSNDIGKADKVIVYKSKRKLTLVRKDSIIFTCSISLGGNPIGHKEKEGDEKTPEGNYVLDYKNLKSSHYKSIHISYPNQEDIANAKVKGFSPGGLIMIHGIRKKNGWIGKLHLLDDWTNGCIAVTNKEMDIIWASVENGTPIEIYH